MKLSFSMITVFALSISLFAEGEWLWYQQYPWVYDNASKDWLFLRGSSDGKIYSYRASIKQWEEFRPEKKPLDPALVKELKDVIQSNIFAVSQKNLNMALDTIHPESPTFESAKDMMTYIFARLQLKYTIEQLEVIEVDGEEAKVQVLQVTQKLSGNAAFRDNRVKMLHTLKRDGKKWKLYSSENLLTEYLNGEI